MTRIAWFLPLLGACAAGGEATPTDGTTEPELVEFGTVDWRRDFPAALEEARERGRDVLLVFQEVPG